MHLGDELDRGPVCKNPVSFPTASPTSVPLTMELATETKRIVSQFDFTDQDANRSVKEFLRQMAEGLESDGTSLSQIPTYVTNVPNGTEKVCFLVWKEKEKEEETEEKEEIAHGHKKLTEFR